MAKFKASDATLSAVPLPRSEEEFLGAAPAAFTPPSAIAPASPAEHATPPRPKRLGATAKQEVATIDDDIVSFTVRIPRHHHDLLEAIAREEERSVAQVTRRLLVPAIEARSRK
jgi:hypothetical protein